MAKYQVKVSCDESGASYEHPVTIAEADTLAEARKIAYHTYIQSLRRGGPGCICVYSDGEFVCPADDGPETREDDGSFGFLNK